MQRILKLFSLSILFFQLQFVYADCSEQEIKDLTKIAETVQIDTEFDRESVKVGLYNNYIVTVQGLSDDFYLLSKDQTVGFFSENAIDGVIVQNVASTANVFYVYSNLCPNVVLRTIKLSMKRYNMYSEYEECEGISGEQLDVCDEFYEKDISYEQFLKKIEDYKERSASLSSGNISNFFSNYAIYIGLGVLIIVAILILIIVMRKKRNRLD